MKSLAKLKKIKGDASFREYYRNKENKSINIISEKGNYTLMGRPSEEFPDWIANTKTQMFDSVESAINSVVLEVNK